LLCKQLPLLRQLLLHLPLALGERGEAGRHRQGGCRGDAVLPLRSRRRRDADPQAGSAAPKAARAPPCRLDLRGDAALARASICPSRDAGRGRPPSGALRGVEQGRRW
jgi:hypothetical protein